MNRETAEKAKELVKEIEALDADFELINIIQDVDFYLQFQGYYFKGLSKSDILPLLQKKLSTAEAKLKKLK